MSKKQYRLKFRTKSAAEKEYLQQSELNSILLQIVENLIVDFPNRNKEFTKPLNTLKVVYEN